MRILVLSDSHSSLRFMFQCVDALMPDAIIHLGDHYDDGETLREEYPTIPLYQVPGNCDWYRTPPGVRDILVDRVLGVDLYMTHGHRHNVKLYTGQLLDDARACRVAAVLYGHTHVAECYREDDGLWVMNPGSCGYGNCSCGIMEVENGKIIACRILRQADVEEML